MEDHGPDGDEHRRFPRARVHLRFHCRVGPEDNPRFQASLTSDNVSVSGAFLNSTFFLPIGTQLDVRFRLDEKEEVNARAEVVRDERPDERGQGRTGMGIRFIQFDGQSEVALARVFLAPRLRTFVESYLKTRRARKLQSELDRVVDALAAWELLQVTQPEDPWNPQGREEE
ncbi:MAG: PilZ domain-containing protein [Myxococcaceae bacterium]|nr:PilZ domain-containing protein [Myxococcaceae bacterium]